MTQTNLIRLLTFTSNVTEIDQHLIFASSFECSFFLFFTSHVGTKTYWNTPFSRPPGCMYFECQFKGYLMELKGYTLNANEALHSSMIWRYNAPQKWLVGVDHVLYEGKSWKHLQNVEKSWKECRFYTSVACSDAILLLNLNYLKCKYVDLRRCGPLLLGCKWDNHILVAIRTEVK